jgi:hypothetical protein
VIASDSVVVKGAEVPVDARTVAGSPPTDNVTIDRLATVATDRFNRLKAFNASYAVRLRVSTHGKRPSTKTELQRFRVLSDFSTQRFRTEIQGDQVRHEDLRWNGKLATRFWPDILSGSIVSATTTPKDLFRFDQLLTLALLRPPSMEGNGIDDGSLVSILRRGEIRNGKEAVLNRPCVVVDATWASSTIKKSLYATAWIDVDRDLLPMRIVLYDHDGKAAKTVNVQEAVQFRGSDGTTLWIPTKLTMTAKFGSMRDVDEEITVDTEQSSLNPRLSDEMFTVAFPPATLVNDLVANRVYRVPGPAPETRHSVVGVGWFIFINAAVFVVILCWIFWRQRRLRGV